MTLGSSSSFWHHLLGVCGRLVNELLLIFLGFLDVVEGFLHLYWWRTAVDVHLGHINTSAIAAQIALQTLLHFYRDRLSTIGDDFVHGGRTRHMTQRTLCCLSETVSRLTHINEEIGGAIDNPLHGETDINDVFVFGQHQRLMAVRLHLGDIDNVHLIDQWRIPMQTRAHLIRQHFTEPEYHPALLLIHLIHTGKGIEAKR